MTLDQIIDDYIAKHPDSGVGRNTIHLIPMHDANGIPTGQLWPVKEGSQIYKQLTAISGRLPEHIIIIK